MDNIELGKRLFEELENNTRSPLVNLYRSIHGTIKDWPILRTAHYLFMERGVLAKTDSASKIEKIQNNWDFVVSLNGRFDVGGRMGLKAGESLFLDDLASSPYELLELVLTLVEYSAEKEAVLAFWSTDAQSLIKGIPILCGASAGVEAVFFLYLFDMENNSIQRFKVNNIFGIYIDHLGWEGKTREELAMKASCEYAEINPVYYVGHNYASVTNNVASILLHRTAKLSEASWYPRDQIEAEITGRIRKKHVGISLFTARFGGTELSPDYPRILIFNSFYRKFSANYRRVSAQLVSKSFMRVNNTINQCEKKRPVSKYYLPLYSESYYYFLEPYMGRRRHTQKLGSKRNINYNRVVHRLNEEYYDYTRRDRNMKHDMYFDLYDGKRRSGECGWKSHRNRKQYEHNVRDEVKEVVKNPHKRSFIHEYSEADIDRILEEDFEKCFA